MRRLVATLVLAASVLAVGVPAAQAEPVQQFSVQLRDIKPDGRYTVVYQSNSFDTTGESPPAVTQALVRLARGISIKPQFLKRARLCDHPRLKDLLVANQTFSFQYKQMLDNLTRTRRVIGDDLNRAELRILDTCIKAQIGSGFVKVDVRPLFGDLIPAFLYLFLSPPTQPGAKVGFGVMSVTDKRAAVVRDSDLVASQKPSFTVNVFDEPTPDGTYGLKLALPPGNVGLIKISVAELRVVVPGITDAKRACASRRGGRCVRWRTTNTFWAEPPACPAGGQLQFEADFTYETELRQVVPAQVACPRFAR
ncbi:MAG: hypothetical protein MUC84_06520 [Solirubrobacteraceae bacterium]|jgi:hypothetical protein|nr:hypothetical protein [Solirubrobacteraceae bacterium]